MSDAIFLLPTWSWPDDPYHLETMSVLNVLPPLRTVYRYLPARKICPAFDFPLLRVYFCLPPPAFFSVMDR